MNDVTYEASYDAPDAGATDHGDPYAGVYETTEGRVFTVTGQDWDTVLAPGEGRKERIVVNMGPQHPSTHGVLRLILELDGETVTEARCGIGYLHTGIEKNLEYRNWTQGVAFVTRMDYLACMANEAGYVLAVEKLLGIEKDVPERAQIIRVIALELQRISSHLVALATGGFEMGALTAMTNGFRDREEILRLIEMMSGLRMNNAYLRPGGVAQDMPEGGVAQIREVLRKLPQQLDGVPTMLVDNGVWKDRTSGIGYLDLAGCMALGVTGPVLRATGLPYDVRKAMPYFDYDRYDFDVPTETSCDVYGRFLIRIEEINQSMRIIAQACDVLEEDARPGHGRRQEDRLARAALDRRRRPGQLPRPHPPHHGRVDGGADPPLQAGDRGLPRAGRPGLLLDRGAARRPRRPRGERRRQPALPRALPRPELQQPPGHRRDVRGRPGGRRDRRGGVDRPRHGWCGQVRPARRAQRPQQVQRAGRLRTRGHGADR